MKKTKKSPLIKHHFRFNEYDNGGESFSLTTCLFEQTGLEQEFRLDSYCNSANFKLTEIIPSCQFRELANQLDKKKSELLSGRSTPHKVSKRNIDEKLGELLFVFKNSTISLLTEYFDNGDGIPEGIYINQKLIMKGYYESEAIINLSGVILDSCSLRSLADELDSVFNSNGSKCK